MKRRSLQICPAWSLLTAFVIFVSNLLVIPSSARTDDVGWQEPTAVAHVSGVRDLDIVIDNDGNATMLVTGLAGQILLERPAGALNWTEVTKYRLIDCALGCPLGGTLLVGNREGDAFLLWVGGASDFPHANVVYKPHGTLWEDALAASYDNNVNMGGFISGAIDPLGNAFAYWIVASADIYHFIDIESGQPLPSSASAWPPPLEPTWQSAFSYVDKLYYPRRTETLLDTTASQLVGGWGFGSGKIQVNQFDYDRNATLLLDSNPGTPLTLYRDLSLAMNSDREKIVTWLRKDPVSANFVINAQRLDMASAAEVVATVDNPESSVAFYTTPKIAFSDTGRAFATYAWTVDNGNGTKRRNVYTSTRSMAGVWDNNPRQFYSSDEQDSVASTSATAIATYLNGDAVAAWGTNYDVYVSDYKVLDDCPNNPDKYSPGICGCNKLDVDADSSGTLDCLESSAPGQPVYALWNGFLNFTNVAEIINKGDVSLTATVAIYDISGFERSSTTFSLTAKSQRDIIVNALAGFSVDSYGVVKISFEYASPSSPGAWDGRMSYYRAAPDASGYTLAFTLPFSTPSEGATYTQFNTFNPSSAGDGVNDAVFNWLSLTNLDPTRALSFTLIRYSLAGELLNTAVVGPVPPLSRIDVDGGHSSGANRAGFNRIAPNDDAIPYRAELIRYGIKTDGGVRFAEPSESAAPPGEETWVSTSTGGRADNWLEISNVTSPAMDCNVYVFNNDNTLLLNQPIHLEPYSTGHIYLSAVLPAGGTGAVKIQPATDAPQLIAQSMFYFKDETGTIDAAYGVPARKVFESELWGSYNLYLRMNNWLRIFNTSSDDQDVTVHVYGADGGVGPGLSYHLSSRSGIDLGLHENQTYGTNPDEYGLVNVSGAGILSEIIRLRPAATTGLDFVMSTSTR